NDNPVHELLTNDRAEARVDAYVGAIMRGDEYTALALWQLDEKVTRAGVPDRRMAVTGVLISARPTAYRVLKTEWWTTCCDPHLVDGPRNAGLARIQVAIELRYGSSPRRLIAAKAGRSGQRDVARKIEQILRVELGASRSS